MLGLTLPAMHGAHSQFSQAAMISFEAGLFGLGGLLIMGPRMGGPVEHHGVMLGAASGILFGVSDTAIKALTGITGAHGVIGLLLSPWLAGGGARIDRRVLRLGAGPAGRRGRAGDRRDGHCREHRRDRRGDRRVRRPDGASPMGVVVQATGVRAGRGGLRADARPVRSAGVPAASRAPASALLPSPAECQPPLSSCARAAPRPRRSSPLPA